MTINSAFEVLYSSVHQLRDTVQSLWLTVIEDRPTDSDMMPAEVLGRDMEELVDFVDEAIEAALDGMRAAETPANVNQVGAALHRSHERVNAAGRLLVTEIGGYGRRQELQTIAAALGREWSAWTSAVYRTLEHSEDALLSAQSALLACWLELTDRLSGQP